MLILLSMKSLFIVLVLITLLIYVIKSKQSLVKLNSLNTETVYPLRGICAFFIVLHHLVCNTILGNYSLLHPIWYWGAPIVGVFFFLSGYGLTKSLECKVDYLKNFFRKRFLKILLPFLLVILIDESCFIATGQFTFTDFFHKVLTGNPSPNTWFVVALCLYYILFYLSARVTKSNLRKLCLLMWLASMLFMVFVVFKKSNPTWYRTVFCLPIGITFAIYEQRIVNRIKNTNDGIRRLFIALFIGMVIFVVLFSIFGDSGKVANPIKFIANHLFPVIVIFLMLFVKIPSNALLEFFSHYSYEIYLIHGILIYFLPPYCGDSPLLLTILVYSITCIVAVGVNKASAMLHR